MQVSKRIDVVKDCPAEIMLLAFVLELRLWLSREEGVQGTVPKAIFDALPPAVFQELLYDYLTHFFPDAGEKLKILVRPFDYFEISLSLSGESS